MTDKQFQIGDIIESGGETYQVLESHDSHGYVIPFPSENVESERVDWDDHYRKIGTAPLPAPSPCSTGDGCPVQGRPMPYFIPKKTA